MDRSRKILLGLSLLALPALATAAHSVFTAAESLCLASGGATYRVVQATTADHRVRIDNSIAQPDLRMELVDRPEIADLVLADEFDQGQPASCRSSRLKTVMLDAGFGTPDVTISLSTSEPAPDYRIYVHSLRHSPQDAAVLLAAIWKAAQKRDFARRH